MVEVKDFPASTKHYDFLDGLRALLALYVVLFHAWATVNDYDHKSVSRYFHVFAYGHYSVCFFIILSGFCLMLPVLKSDLRLSRGIGSFLRRRAWRILPPYYFALLLSLLLMEFLISKRTGAHWDMSLAATPRNIFTHLVMIQNFIPDDMFKINYVFWSISVEWQIYFFFPLLLLSWRSLGAVYTTTLAIAISSLIELGLHHYLHIQPRVWFLGLFALGMLAAYLGFSPKCGKAPWGVVVLVTGLAFGVSLYFHREMATDLMFGLLASAILVVVSKHPEGRLHGLLSWKPLVFVGSFSYSIYLIHAPLLQILWQYPFFPLQSHANIMCVALVVVGIPLILLFSYLFYLCCEKPFVQRKGPNQSRIRISDFFADKAAAPLLPMDKRNVLHGD